MTARYETPRTDVVDRIVEQVARDAYVGSSGTPALSLAEYRGNARIRESMAVMVRHNVEATLAALRAIAYAPDGFCLLDGMAQAVVARERQVTWLPGEAINLADLRIGQAVVDMTLDRLALLPVDPRP